MFFKGHSSLCSTGESSKSLPRYHLMMLYLHLVLVTNNTILQRFQSQNKTYLYLFHYNFLLFLLFNYSISHCFRQQCTHNKKVKLIYVAVQNFLPFQAQQFEIDYSVAIHLFKLWFLTYINVIMLILYTKIIMLNLA